MTTTDIFTTHRNLLFTVSYEMLGSAADAEDVLQEVWLRWADVLVDEVRDPRAYLVRMTTRLSLNRLRTLARRREDYVGTWLPEPVLTAPDVADDVELADSVSTAWAISAYGTSKTSRSTKTAQAVEKSEPAVRQIASRARTHVADRRPRASVSAAERDAVIERFRAATEGGDLQSLMDVLAPDVVLMTDGGGKVQAALNPIYGRDKVLRFLTAVTPDAIELVPVWLNGSPAIQFVVGGQRDGVGTMLVEDGVVTRLFLVRNPDKLGSVTAEVGLSR